MDFLNKRGVTVQSVVIGMIVLVIVAAILFFFYKSLPYTETVNKEACRQSVLLRSQSLAGLQPGQVLGIPLNCKTEEIKITTANEDVIKKEIANAMYDCWWMLGEGKLDFFTENVWQSYGIPGAGAPRASCIICSTIRFDDNVKAKINSIDMTQYLIDTKIPTKNITYFDYFTEQADRSLAVDVKAPPIDPKQDYTIVFMGIRGRSYWEVLQNDLKFAIGAAGFSAMTAGPWTTGKVIGKVGAAAIKHPLVAVIAIGSILGTQGITTAIDNGIVNSHCDGDWQGCYHLILSPLKASQLGTICQNIESIP
ncbi:MAG: hypothetical protein ACPLXC_03595 [Candidatus Pacearchaeota archaeon]